MNKPHKHAEAIKAWADGKDIEWKHDQSVLWSNCPNPLWDENLEYRVKPNKVRFRNYLRHSPAINATTADISFTGDECGELYFIKWIGQWQEVEV